MLRRALGRTEFAPDVSVARDGEEAVQALSGPERPFDLVLLDLHLPRKTGLEVLASLETLRGKLPPIVVLTGTASPRELEEARRLGAVAVHELPAELPRLAVLMGDVCRSYLSP